MKNKIEKLILNIKDTNLSDAKFLALISSTLINDKNFIKFASEYIDESIDIDLNELESIVNPNKFLYPKTNIGRIGIEK